MKSSKKYAGGTKLLATLLLLLSLFAVGYGSVVTLYGLVIDALGNRPMEETSWFTMLVESGPQNGYQGQTIEDLEEYYSLQYASTPENIERKEQLQTLYDPSVTNIRARVAVVSSETQQTYPVQTLGGAWTPQTVLVQSQVYEQDPSKRLEIGFDSAFTAQNDTLWQYRSAYDFIQAQQGILMVLLLGGGVASLLLMLYLLLATGHRPEDTPETPIHLRFFDRWPVVVLAIAAGCVLALAVGVWDNVYSGNAGIVGAFSRGGIADYGIDFLLLLAAGMAWLVLLAGFFLLRTVVVRIKARQFWSTTITYYVLRPVLRFGKQQVQRLEQRREQNRMQPQSYPTPIETQNIVPFEANGEIQPAEPGRMGMILQIDADKVQERVQDFAQKAQSTARRAVDKAKQFEWEGSGAQNIFRRTVEAVKRLWRTVCGAINRMGLMEQGLLCSIGVILLYLFFYMVGDCSGDVFGIVLLFSALVLVGAIWVLRQCNRLQTGAKKLAQGNLSYKIDLAHLHGPFRAHAEWLNNISAGMAVEIERRMKSEHLKTELLTNVSHDIKTPLTSIINYVDLLQKTDPQPAEAKEYAQVLERQSQRLKKLLEDLIEASKASTGNINVDLAPTDAAELLRQAAGEYSERLKEQNLSPVLRIGDDSCTILADGRLLWRVFDNLLGNIVKYALAGTRVYLDMSQRDGWCTIAIKNISREELNIETEELMERFVRGDAARATEGSGLGLSIARSLTECMGGHFDLAIDGDLFKVTLAFPTTAPLPEQKE